MKKIRIAMLGCGAVADLYLPVFKYLPEVELAALADLDGSRAGEMARRYGVGKVLHTAADLAKDKSIDAVIVATPPRFHADNIAVLAGAGKHILCEKPMAHTVEDCHRIIESCRNNGVKLQLGHMKRFMRGNQKVKAVIDAGLLGKVFMVECQWDVNVPGLVGTYREEAATGGGVLQDHGPHAFDLVRWWTGSDVESISATVRIIHPGRVNEDTAIVMAEHAGGVTGLYHMTRIFFGRAYDHDYYKIYGSEGTLVVCNEHHFPTMSLESPQIALYGPNQQVKNLDVLHGWNIDDQVFQNSAFYSELKAFSECILQDSEPRVTGEDGLHAMECVAASYESAFSGKRINLPFIGEQDFGTLFHALKERELKNLGSEYRIGEEYLRLDHVPDPVLAYRPARTGEKWDPRENDMTDMASTEGLQGTLKWSDLQASP
ncbi:MAG: Gfo/Idh/MocA family oxidoreductase [Clostridia bacterium]